MQYTNNFKITSGYFTTNKGLSTFLSSFLLVGKFVGVYADVRAKYSRKNILRVLIFSKFLESKSVNNLIKSDLRGVINCSKDVYYKVKNCFKINWRTTLYNQAYECIDKLEPVDMKTTLSHKIPCIIADDTNIPKTGKVFELIGKIFSHAGHKYKLGFKCLNVTYWTGKTSINLDFSLHIEKRKDGKQGMSKKELKHRYTKNRNPSTHGVTRLTESLNKKTSSLIKVVKRILQRGIEAKYLLVDSWFFNNELVQFIKQTSLHLITRPKRNNWKYKHNGRDYTIGQLMNKYKGPKFRKWSGKLKMFTVAIGVEFKGQALQLHLYKPKKRGSSWHVLIGTNRSLSSIKTYEIYQNRWSIEVVFKELKQYFNFGKSQSRDFIGQISDHTICLMAYNFLSVYKCVNDYQSIGALFDHVKQNWIRPNVMEVFWNEILKIAQKISKVMDLDVSQIVEKVINDSKFLQIFNLNRLLLTTET